MKTTRWSSVLPGATASTGLPLPASVERVQFGDGQLLSPISRFINASDSALADDNDIAAAHRAAYEDHFELDLSA